MQLALICSTNRLQTGRGVIFGQLLIAVRADIPANGFRHGSCVERTMSRLSTVCLVLPSACLSQVHFDIQVGNVRHQGVPAYTSIFHVIGDLVFLGLPLELLWLCTCNYGWGSELTTTVDEALKSIAMSCHHIWSFYKSRFSIKYRENSTPVEQCMQGGDWLSNCVTRDEAGACGESDLKSPPAPWSSPDPAPLSAFRWSVTFMCYCSGSSPRSSCPNFD